MNIKRDFQLEYRYLKGLIYLQIIHLLKYNIILLNTQKL